MRIKIAMKKEDMPDANSNPRESVEFTMRALRAAQTMCQRRLDRNIEPVTYEGQRIKGFLMSIITGNQCMLLGVDMGIEDQVRAASAILASLREHMSDRVFFELLGVLYKSTEPDSDDDDSSYEKASREIVECHKHKEDEDECA